MSNAIEIKNLTKSYDDFLLDNISFNVPAGFVSGFIGQNGSGKTTTLKLILGMALKDGGGINLFGKPAEDVSLKEDVGVLFETPYFQEDWTPEDVEKALRPFYKKWSSAAYNKYLQSFGLSKTQKFKTFSRGMKMKLGMAATLSHDAKLILLDEPTSGLDPVARDEMLGILRDYMLDEDKSIFFSTHITADLDKIADYITYINKGKIVYSGTKDKLLESYCVVRGGPGELPPAKHGQIIGLRQHSSGFEGMVETENIAGFPSGVIAEPASMDDIMVYFGKGEKNG